MKLYSKLENLPSDNIFNNAQIAIKENVEAFRTIDTQLSIEDRIKNRKLGNKMFAYADAAESYGVQHEEIMPRSFEPAMLSKRLEAYRKFVRLERYLTQLVETVSDAKMAVGMDVMALSKVVHDGLRSANAISPNYDESLQTLNDFFRRMSSELEAEEATVEETATEEENTEN